VFDGAMRWRLLAESNLLSHVLHPPPPPTHNCSTLSNEVIIIIIVIVTPNKISCKTFLFLAACCVHERTIFTARRYA